MQIHLTKEAFKKYTAKEGGEADFAECRRRLEEEAAGGSLAYATWHGAPAVYALNAYWKFEYNVETKELNFLDCLGVFRAVTVPRWRGGGLEAQSGS